MVDRLKSAAGVYSGFSISPVAMSLSGMLQCSAESLASLSSRRGRLGESAKTASISFPSTSCAVLAKNAESVPPE